MHPKQSFLALLAVATAASAMPRFWRPSFTAKEATNFPRLEERDGASNGILTSTVVDVVVVTVTDYVGGALAAPGTSPSSAPTSSLPADLTVTTTPPAPAPPAPVTTSSSQATPAAMSAPADVASPPPSSSSGGSSTLNADMILAVMPMASSCDGAPIPSECATAAQAVDPLKTSFTTYKIGSSAAQAAIVALIAFETSELKYNHNHFPAPGRPGQGTRNLQMGPDNIEYGNTVLGAAATAGKSAEDIVNVLRANPTTDFGSAAWFMSTKCPAVLQQFATDANGAWQAYLGPGCISTTDTAARDAYWTAAMKAFNVS